MKKTVTTIPQMMLLNIINIGYVVFWSVDGAFMTIYLTKKGYSPFGLSAATAGAILAIGQFMVCVGFIFGLLSDGTRTKMGKRLPYMISGVLVLAAGYALIPHAKSLALVIALQTLVYFALVWASIPYYSLIPDATPEEKLGACNAFFSLFGAIGTIVAYVAIVGVLAEPKNYPHMFRFLPFYATAGVAVVTMLITVAFTREDTDYSRQPKVEPMGKRLADGIKELPKMKDLLYFMAVNLFMWMGLQGFVKFFTLFMDADVGVSFTIASKLLGAIPVVAILCAVPLGFLADKISRKLMLMSGFIAATVVMVCGYLFIHKYTGQMFGVDKTLVVTIAILVFAAASVIDMFLLMGVIAPTLMPKDKLGFYMGVVSLMTGLGGVFGVFLSGWLSTMLEHGMHCRVIFLIGAVCLVCSILFLTKCNIKNAWDLAKEREAAAKA